MRKAFKIHFGDDWYRLPNVQVAQAARLAAFPSVIYDPFLAFLNGWQNNCNPIIEASLIVHLTGGSFRGKLFNDFLVRHGFSAILDNLFDPPEIMRLCGEWRGFDSRGFYDTFNGGQGALMVVDECDVDGAIAQADKWGIEAKRCGTIFVNSRPSLVIQSKFGSGEEIVID